MRLGSYLRGLGGQAAVLLVLSVSASACVREEGRVECDAAGENCVVCEGYGCFPANPNEPGAGKTGGAAATTGAGGSGGGAAGTGGDASGAGGDASGAGGGDGGAGGGTTCDPAQATCPCASDEECASAPGTQCISGLCIVGCEFSYQCGAGKVCANGSCVVVCDEESPCPEAGTTCKGGACIPDPANPACDDAKPCPGGETCAGGVCKTPCVTNGDCAAGEVCDAGSGACIPDPSPKPGCGESAPCAGVGQQCMADGYCHYACANVDECKKIDVRFVACDGGICKTEEEVDPECGLEQPCPDGKDCISNECL